VFDEELAAVECSVKMLVDVGVQSARSCNAAVRVAPHDPTADQSVRIGVSRIGRPLRISDISLGVFLKLRALRLEDDREAYLYAPTLVTPLMRHLAAYPCAEQPIVC
jgi:hypothetical protein